MKQTPSIKSIGISYVTETEILKETVQKLKDDFPNASLLERVTSPTISTHTGKGAFALIYFSDPD